MTPVELTEAAGVIVALVSSVVMPTARQRHKDRNAANSELTRGDANLRDDQREFIAVLQEENKKWRVEVDALRNTIDNLRNQIDELRDELAAERRARKASEARVAAEQSIRDNPPEGET